MFHMSFCIVITMCCQTIGATLALKVCEHTTSKPTSVLFHVSRCRHDVISLTHVLSNPTRIIDPIRFSCLWPRSAIHLTRIHDPICLNSEKKLKKNNKNLEVTIFFFVKKSGRIHFFYFILLEIFMS